MIPPIDIARIADAFAAAVARLEEALEENPTAPAGGAAPAEVLVGAMNNLLDVLREAERERPAALSSPSSVNAQDIQALGNYGIDLLSDLSAWARRLNLAEEAREIEGLSFPLACWIARHGGEISNLAPVVNTAAALANSLNQSPDLERLFAALSEILNAVSPSVSQDLDKTDPTRPWRILLLNRAIVATRTHQPVLMETAFQSVIDLLPDDAPNFFRTGMEQMQTLDYPDTVRRVMQRYFDQWCSQGLLH